MTKKQNISEDTSTLYRELLCDELFPGLTVMTAVPVEDGDPEGESLQTLIHRFREEVYGTKMGTQQDPLSTRIRPNFGNN